MHRALWGGLGAAALGLVGCGAAPHAGAAASPPNGRLSVMGFYAAGDHVDLSAVLRHPQSIGVFVPFWYSVEANGSLKSHLDPQVLAEVRRAGIPITPLVNDGTARQAFLNSPWTRFETARNIADIVGTEHFQGVNIDFEPPVNRDREQLVAFLIDLRDMLPRRDTITLSIVPNSGGAYDFAKLKREVNQFVLMSYDLHDDGSPAGPVAPVPWVENVLHRLLALVPARQIYLGIPLYGYVWPVGSTHAATIPYSAVTPAMTAHAQWNGRYDETEARFTSGGTPYVAWWESLQGINEKIQLARRDHLAGVALWRLGYQTEAVVQLLLHQIGPQR
ncbi:MAG: glycoside hydrolase [Firmicutes bacterium]|nr:glycoside hydrolase [Alicyclobacillaceae bacterium]MCL6496338.1 glycoside hydrolase [Bacillota bacterium]